MAQSTKSKRRPPKKTGRPSVYDPASCPAIARKLRGEGKTLQDIAESLGVARSTFDEWRKVYPEFSSALEEGDRDADDRVERSLFERAVGYTHPEEKLLTVTQGAGMPSVVERHEVTAHYAPDPTAIKFWLTNRRRDRWSDRTKVEGNVTLTLEQVLAEASKPTETKPEEPKA